MPNFHIQSVIYLITSGAKWIGAYRLSCFCRIKLRASVLSLYLQQLQENHWNLKENMHQQVHKSYLIYDSVIAILIRVKKNTKPPTPHT